MLKLLYESLSLPEYLSYFFMVRAAGLHHPPKLVSMIHMLQMAKFMHNNIVNAPLFKTKYADVYGNISL